MIEPSINEVSEGDSSNENIEDVNEQNDSSSK